MPKKRKTKMYRVEVPTSGADIYFVEAESPKGAIEKVSAGMVELEDCQGPEALWDEAVAEVDEED